MGLLITVSLIAWNVYGSVKAPPSRGFSYIEIWITGVQCNILLAILEYASILTIKRTNLHLKIFNKETFVNTDNFTKIMDFTSLILSLIFFSAFSILYWYFLLSL